MALSAMTDLGLFLTGSSRAGRPCRCAFVAWLISFRPAGAEYVTVFMKLFWQGFASSFSYPDVAGPAAAAPGTEPRHNSYNPLEQGPR